MFSLNELTDYEIHGTVAVDKELLLVTVPKDVAGPLLEGKLNEIYVDDKLVFRMHTLRVHEDIRILLLLLGRYTLVDANSMFRWHASPGVLRFWKV